MQRSSAQGRALVLEIGNFRAHALILPHVKRRERAVWFPSFSLRVPQFSTLGSLNRPWKRRHGQPALLFLDRRQASLTKLHLQERKCIEDALAKQAPSHGNRGYSLQARLLIWPSKGAQKR